MRKIRPTFVAVAAVGTLAGSLTGGAVPGGAVPAGVVPAASTVVDSWSEKVTIRTPEGWWASPVHSALLPDGSVLMWGLQRDEEPATTATRTLRSAWVFHPTPLGDPVPQSLTISPIEEPVEIDIAPQPDGWLEDDLYCSGHVLTVHGQLFTAGGNRRSYRETGTSGSFGVDYQTSFDWRTQTWTRLANRLQGASPSGNRSRWYPSVTKLPDGRMLVQGGFSKVLPTAEWNGTAEIWDPATGTNVVISPYGWTPPEVMNSAYTHAFVLPQPVGGRQVLELGETGVPVFMSTGSTATWNVVNSRPRPGSEQFNQTRILNGRSRWSSDVAPNWGASTAMLPLRLTSDSGYSNGSVVVAGGPTTTPHGGNIDGYDPITNTWRAGSLVVARNYPNTVALPDGRVLVIGGGGTTDPNLHHAEYLDPRTGFAQSLGSADGGEVRGYHATSLLLPDGRVLLAGGRDVQRLGTLEKPSLRYYEPDYLTKDRPELMLAPPALNVGTPYAAWTDRPITELVLVALGSQTHSYDMNQRVVQVPVLANLAVGPGLNAVIGGGLPGAQTLPPGFYMLFALDDQRVPSMAKILKVNPAPTSG